MANELKRYGSFFKVFQRELEKQINSMKLPCYVNLSVVEPSTGEVETVTCLFRFPEKLEYRQVGSQVRIGYSLEEFSLVKLTWDGLGGKPPESVAQRIERIKEAGIYVRLYIGDISSGDFLDLMGWDFKSMEFYWNLGRKRQHLSMQEEVFELTNLKLYSTWLHDKHSLTANLYELAKRVIVTSDTIKPNWTQLPYRGE